MQTRHVSIVLASVLAIGVSLPAAAADKVTGVHKEFQRVSEAVANVPGQPGRTLRQVSIVWKSTSSNPIFDQAWVSAVAQIDALGEDSKEQGYGTSHYPSGDVNYFTWEGAIKHTVKEGGDYDRVAQGKFTWLGGTGKFKAIKGSGTYTCKFTSKGGQCDWEGEPEM
jgi:hypothetical protein